MAKIGAVKLKVDIKGAKALVDVTYDITYSKTEQKNKQVFKEVVRLIGDDTHKGDPAEAGADDVLGFLTPVFNKKTTPSDELKVSRHHTKTFRTAQLNEDESNMPNPDELRALVTLLPVPPDSGKIVNRESPMVKKKIV
jgi:hypothetical protein